jgi:hypothetical protein
MLIGVLETDVPVDVKASLVDSLWGFVIHQDHVKLSGNWLRGGFITSSDGKNLFELKDNHKRTILKKLHQSKHLSIEEKATVLNETLKEDKSDLANGCRLVCEASSSDLAVKERIWIEITDPKSTFSFYERRSKCQGFYSWDYMEMNAPFAERFYDSLEGMQESHTWKYLEAFFF